MDIDLKTGILHIENSPMLSKLVSFGSRINKKRGFLFVSKVLGKHIPVRPSVMKQTYAELSRLIPNSDEDTLFIGFAETATALGQGVFEAYDKENSMYIHSTRFKTSQPIFFSFYEEHCHAPSHIFYEPKEPRLKEKLLKAKRVILIDDEVSTGNTANNLIKELKKVLPCVEKFYLLTLLNWSEKKYNNFEYLSLYTGKFSFIPEMNNMEKLEPFISEAEKPLNLDNIIPYGFGRYGVDGLSGKWTALSSKGKTLCSECLKGEKVLVLGTSEFMYQPYQLALSLEKRGINVKYQATTRSPVNVDGAIESRLSFMDNYFENIHNFLYNVIEKDYDTVIICYETTSLPKNYRLKKALKNNFKVIELFFSQEIKKD